MPGEDPVVVHGKGGQPIDLPIAQGPPTGHVWLLQLPSGVHQIDSGPPRPIAPDRAMGAGSGAALRVEAKPGEYMIVANLVRPWEPDKIARQVRIRLLVE